MNAPDKALQLLEAERFILDNRRLGLIVPYLAPWLPREKTALVKPEILSVDILKGVRDSASFLSRGIKLMPVMDPDIATVARALSADYDIDPHGSLDQKYCIVRISARSDKAFKKFWKEMSIYRGFPHDARTDEIGLTAVSGMQFDIVRAALTRVRKKDTHQQLEPVHANT